MKDCEKLTNTDLKNRSSVNFKIMFQAITEIKSCFSVVHILLVFFNCYVLSVKKSGRGTLTSEIERF